MTFRFSTTNRPNFINVLKSEQFDLLVIGGGITGAGVALDAASRGLKVALCEKNDFAQGTSSKSTKLIHGGLRYLKQLEFGLVKEVGSERAIVHKLAPHLVVPEKMLLPLFDGKSLGYWLTSFGLMIYDWLAGVKREDQRRMLTRPQTLRHEPLLKKDGIKGGAIYSEYRTDDARLTVEIMKASARHGVVAMNYVRVANFVYDDQGKLSGVNATDEQTGESLIIKSTVVVNAAGSWVDDLRSLNKSKTGKRLFLTKGVHIVVAHEKLPVKQAIYFDVHDGRMIFAIPRGRVTYIGTTDTPYTGSKDHVVTYQNDAWYLIEAVNTMFPDVTLTIMDVESSWAGLRPLIYEDGKSASELSRKDEIFESPSGLISIAGGKLTGYRKMAERVVDMLVQKYFNNRMLKNCSTQSIALASHTFTSYQDVRKYQVALRRQLEPFGFSILVAHYLVENYGQQTDTIMGYFREHHEPIEDKRLALLSAELWYCTHHEMVVSLSDFFVRRTGLLYFEIEVVKKYRDKIAFQLQTYLHWTDTKKETELRMLAKEMEDASNFS